ncbi:MAG: ribonuclease HII [Candidatus Peregrinibacteria bacterium]|nr:ribonuclease HII [Candidatus Peregrinibacteria bacterium]
MEIIAGVDEAGRGPLAGPVVAAAVIFPEDIKVKTNIFRDSKKCSPYKIKNLYKIIAQECDWGVGIISAQEIDAIGIKKATEKAMNIAVSQLQAMPDKLLVDGKDRFRFPIDSEDVIRGDEKIPEISAASIIAKYTRDEIMCDHADMFPQFDFQSNMGYGTAKHRKMLDEGVYCEIHRKSYEPLKTFLLQGRLF